MQNTKCTIVVAVDGVTIKTVHLVESLIRHTDENVKVIFLSLDADPLFSELIETLGIDRFTVHEEENKVGQAKGYNNAFKIIESEYTAWLSNDTYLTFNCVRSALEILDSRQDFGMVGLKTKDIAGPYISSQYIGGILPTGILNVNQGVLRTSLLHEIGGFDEEFVNYGIDPVLTTQVLLSNYKVCLTKRVALHHDRDWGGNQSEVPLTMKIKTKEWKKRYNEKFVLLLPRNGSDRLKNRVKSIVFSRIKFAPRTLKNIFLARTISMFDFFLTFNEPFHLVQDIRRIKSRESKNSL
jgi:GT2 family glycosyltransferase